MWFRPACAPALDPWLPAKLERSRGCWGSSLKWTLLGGGGSGGGLSSLGPASSSYCRFRDAGTMWKRMCGRRMACMKMFWALEAMQGKKGVTPAGVQSTEMNYVYMIRGGTTITCYHSRWKIGKDKGGCVVLSVQKERDTQSSA